MTGRRLVRVFGCAEVCLMGLRVSADVLEDEASACLRVGGYAAMLSCVLLKVTGEGDRSLGVADDRSSKDDHPSTWSQISFQHLSVFPCSRRCCSLGETLAEHSRFCLGQTDASVPLTVSVSSERYPDKPGARKASVRLMGSSFFWAR